MTKVPERQLSYGELLHNLKLTYKSRQRIKEVKAHKELKENKHRTPKVRHEYSYYEVMEHIRRIGNEEL
jgi:hypothetical protein